MEIELTGPEQQIVLMALWNHKLATGQLHAVESSVPIEALAAAHALIVQIDRTAAKLGGNPNDPFYGWLGSSPE